MTRAFAISAVLTLVVLAAAAPQGAARAQAHETIPPPLSDGEHLLGWIVGAGDNQGRPFLIIDKVTASISVYDARGELIGAAPALLGLAHGDGSTAGIGDRELADILPEERTTPAGRFSAFYGPAFGGETVLWVDFDTAISLHPVVTTNKNEARLERLQSPTPDDNFITFGCINVSREFYDQVVEPGLQGDKSVVYILPDTELITDVFPDVAAMPLGEADPAISTVADLDDPTP